MSRRVGLVVALALSILSAPLSSAAQQRGKVPRIGFLGGASPSAAAHLVDALRQGLRDLGYVEGQNIAIEYRFAEGKAERLPDLAAELVRLKVDVIVAPNPPGALAAKNATTTIPIVMAIAGDPVGLGLVASLARPGGNVTGLSNVSVELAPKQLQLLKQAVPKVSRVAVLWNPGNKANALSFRELEVAARSLGVQLQPLEAQSPDDFDSAFAAMTRERAGALVVFPDALVLLHQRRIVDLAAKRRLPAMYALREAVDAGGLMSYSPSFTDLFRRAATYVDKILKGAKPADLPVEQPTKFEFVINLKTAKALGLTIPQSVLIRADQVIQ